MQHRPWFLALLVLCGSAAALPAQGPWPTRDWAKSSPRAVGLDPAPLEALDREIAEGKYGQVDGFLVIRHGKIAFERQYRHDYDSIYGGQAKERGPLNAHDPAGQYNYFNPWWHPYYRRGTLHSLQSVTKTITSVIIGAATARGEFPGLETPVLAFFDTAKVKEIDDRKRRMTLRHLLTMSDGLDWHESLPYTDPRNSAVVMEASFDWVEYAINHPMGEEPGARFNYNSGASQILSHVFRVATGRDIEEYAARHLFAPLGITRWYWKRTPTGLPDTEGGLYLEPRDLAKIWYLWLRGGKWEGKTVVSPEWVEASVRPSVAVNRNAGVHYGLKWWLYPYDSAATKHAWSGSGFGGQFPMAIPEYDLVVVFTGWNILPGGPSLPRQAAMQRVLSAVRDAGR